MTVEEARANVGKRVMSKDHNMMPTAWRWHGPYHIAQVTKGGLVILKERPDDRVRPSVLALGGNLA